MFIYKKDSKTNLQRKVPPKDTLDHFPLEFITLEFEYRDKLKSG